MLYYYYIFGLNYILSCLDLYMLWFNFILGLNFISVLFLGMLMYSDEFETMKDQI